MRALAALRMFWASAAWMAVEMLATWCVISNTHQVAAKFASSACNVQFCKFVSFVVTRSPRAHICYFHGTSKSDSPPSHRVAHADASKVGTPSQLTGRDSTFVNDLSNLQT